MKNLTAFHVNLECIVQQLVLVTLLDHVLLVGIVQEVHGLVLQQIMEKKLVTHVFVQLQIQRVVNANQDISVQKDQVNLSPAQVVCIFSGYMYSILSKNRLSASPVFSFNNRFC